MVQLAEHPLFDHVVVGLIPYLVISDFLKLTPAAFSFGNQHLLELGLGGDRS